MSAGMITPPHSVDMERAALAVVLYQQVAPSTLDLDGTDFYNPDHEALWNVLEAMESAGEGIDPITAADKLRGTGARLADPNLVTNLTGGPELAVNAGQYADAIRTASQSRHALAAIERAAQRVTAGENPAEVMADLEAGAQTPTRHRNRVGRRVTLAEVKAERRTWIKKDWYPIDYVTALAGYGGEGKSTFTLADVAAGSRGELHGRCWRRPARSLIVATEDTQSDQKLRLRAAGVAEQYVQFFTVANPDDDTELPFKLTLDLAELERAVIEFSADMVVIDPLSSVVEGDLNKAKDMRDQLDPLSALARRNHIAVLLVHHFNKGGGNSSRKMTGSEAIRDAVRCAIFFAHDKESEERVLTLDKCSYSKLEGQSFNFELSSAPAVDDDGHEMADEEGNRETVPLVRMLGETDNSVDKIINTVPQGQDDGDDRNDATSFLISYLSDHGGESSAQDALKAGRAVGFSDKQLRNARQRSKSPRIETKSPVVGSGWVWWIDTDELPRTHQGLTRTQVSEGESLESLGEPLRESDHHRAHIEPIEPSSQKAVPMGSIAVPMGEPAGQVAPLLSLVPDDPCPMCGHSLTGTPGQRLCAARHRRAQDAAS